MKRYIRQKVQPLQVAEIASTRNVNKVRIRKHIQSILGQASLDIITIKRGAVYQLVFPAKTSEHLIKGCLDRLEQLGLSMTVKGSLNYYNVVF